MKYRLLIIAALVVLLLGIALFVNRPIRRTLEGPVEVRSDRTPGPGAKATPELLPKGYSAWAKQPRPAVKRPAGAVRAVKTPEARRP